MPSIVLWSMIVVFTLVLTLVLVETYAMFEEQKPSLKLSLKGKLLLSASSLVVSFVMVYAFMKYAIGLE